MTREPPLNWVGVTFASSAPDAVSKTSLATLSPSWTKRRADDRQQRGDEVERAVRRGDQDAQDDRHDRRGEERQARRRAGSGTRATASGLTGVPRSAESASKYARDCPTERSEYSKNGTSASSQPQARAPSTQRPAVERRRAAPDGHVPALVVAVARLRADVRAGQRDLAVGRHGQPGRRVEPGAQLGRVDPRVHGDADRVAVVVDPGERSGTGTWPASRGRSRASRPSVCCASRGLRSRRASRCGAARRVAVRTSTGRGAG